MRKTLVLTLLVGLLAAHSALAQRGPGGRIDNFQEAMETANDSLIARLDLTTEQVPAVRAILAARTDSLMALRPRPGDGRGQFQAMRAKREEINKETELALSALLSEEQMATYREVMREQSRSTRQQRPRRGNGQRGF
ncbi:MAG: hypothetical protein F4Y90_01030 [Rhodothermaceae bacterium]|nr:hypothetical protein [Rhodothermaceae bacterium]